MRARGMVRPKWLVATESLIGTREMRDTRRLAEFPAVPLPRLSGGADPAAAERATWPSVPASSWGRAMCTIGWWRVWGGPIEVGISAREAQVLAALGEHLTNAEIGARLFIQIRTVESHVSSLLRKLQAEDRRALAAVARNLRAIRRARRPRESRLLSRCRRRLRRLRRLRRSLGGWPSGRRCPLRCGAWSRPSDQAGSVRRAWP